MKMKKVICAALALLALVVIGGGAAFKHAGYEASAAAMAQMGQGEKKENITAFQPEEVCAGLVFYPGGLVDHAAYAPLMRMLASRGVLCLLVQMPMDLAVLDADAAQGLQQRYPGVERWLIGGHSLGGAMAADYAAKHPEEFDGVLLLGAYSAADLSDTDLSVLSVYGTQDGVLSREKYEACRRNYPAGFEEFVIEGGCHAYFGDYGFQKGDGTPSVSREMQMGMTASAVSAWIDSM